MNGGAEIRVLHPGPGAAQAEGALRALASMLERAAAVARLIETVCERPELLKLGVAAAVLKDEVDAANLHLLAVEYELRAVLTGDRS